MKCATLVEQVVRDFTKKVGMEDEKFTQEAVDRLTVSNPHRDFDIPENQVPSYRDALVVLLNLAFHAPKKAEIVIERLEKKFGKFKLSTN
jgi:hypothetical protein